VFLPSCKKDDGVMADQDDLFLLLCKLSCEPVTTDDPCACSSVSSWVDSTMRWSDFSCLLLSGTHALQDDFFLTTSIFHGGEHSSSVADSISTKIQRQQHSRSVTGRCRWLCQQLFLLIQVGIRRAVASWRRMNLGSLQHRAGDLKRV
jgi:hypothetical protein